MIVFDTETTGLPKPDAAPVANQPQLIEFAGIKLDNETLEEVDRLEFFVDPEVKLPKIIIKITNITDSQLAGQPTFPLQLKRLTDFFLGEDTMVAHNMDFDQHILLYELRRIDMEYKFPWPPVQICTVEASFDIKGHRLKLSQLHQMATGEEFDGAHRAMVDTEALVKCVKWLRGKELL